MVRVLCVYRRLSSISLWHDVETLHQHILVLRALCPARAVHKNLAKGFCFAVRLDSNGFCWVGKTIDVDVFLDYADK